MTILNYLLFLFTHFIICRSRSKTKTRTNQLIYADNIPKIADESSGLLDNLDLDTTKMALNTNVRHTAQQEQNGNKDSHIAGDKIKPFVFSDKRDTISNQFIIFMNSDICSKSDQQKRSEEFLSVFECYSRNEEMVNEYPDIVSDWFVVNRIDDCTVDDEKDVVLEDYCISNIIQDRQVKALHTPGYCECRTKPVVASEYQWIQEIDSEYFWHLRGIDPEEHTDRVNYVYCDPEDYDPEFDIIVMDTGIDITHSEFAGIDYDLLHDCCDGAPWDWHGTMVAGTVLGDKFGVFKAQNTNVKLIDVRVLNSQGSASYGMVFNAYGAIIDHLQNTPRKAIINMSFGGYDPAGTFDVLLNTIKAHGGIIFAAAGNDMVDSWFFRPAGSPDVITVGALASDMNPAYFSNYLHDWELDVPGWGDFLWAPGHRIIGAYPDEQVVVSSGTSFSSPITAGIAANILLTDGEMDYDDILQKLRSDSINDVCYSHHVAVYGKYGSSYLVGGDRYNIEFQPRVQLMCESYVE